MSIEFPEFKPVFQSTDLSPSELKAVQAEALQLFEDHESLLLPRDLPMEDAGENSYDPDLERWDSEDRILRNQQEKVMLVVRASINSAIFDIINPDIEDQETARVTNMITECTLEEVVTSHELAHAFLGDVPYHIDIELDGYREEEQNLADDFPYDKEHLGRLEMTVSSDASRDTLAGYLVQSERPDLDANVVRTFRNWLADAVEAEKQ